MSCPRGTMKMKPRSSARAVVRDAMCLGYPRHAPAIVPNADQGTSERMHGLPGQLPGPQTGAIDDGPDHILVVERRLLLSEQPRELALDDPAAGPPDLAQ